MRRALPAMLLLAASGVAAAQTPAPAAPLGPKTLTPSHVACTDVPAADMPLAPITIRSGHVPDLRHSFAPGDLVVLSGAAGDGLAVGQRFFVRRLRPGLHGENATGRLHTAGWLSVVASDANAAIGRIDHACDAIEQGDVLTPFEPPVLPAAVAPAGQPQFDAVARVLFGKDRREMFGAGDVFGVDRGTTGGLAPGDRVSIYRDRRNGTPLVPMGEGVVVRALDATAQVLLLHAREAVYTGDLVAVHR